MLEEIQLFGTDNAADEAGEAPQVRADQSSAQATRPKVFIVHGHDAAIKTTVARFVEKLELEAVILHERANSGATIVEKFEHEASTISYAVVLLTADDIRIGKR